MAPPGSGAAGSYLPPYRPAHEPGCRPRRGSLRREPGRERSTGRGSVRAWRRPPRSHRTPRAARGARSRGRRPRQAAHDDAARAHAEELAAATATHATALADAAAAHAAALAELRAERDQLEQALSGNRAHTAQVEQALAAARDTVATRDAEVAAQLAAVADRDARIGQLKAELDELEGQNAAYQEQVLKAYQKIKADESTVARAKKAMAIALTLLDEDKAKQPGT